MAAAAGLRAGVLIGFALLAGADARALGLVAHHATYEMRRGRADPDSPVLAVRGQLEIRFEGSCDGWHSTQFVGFRTLEDDDGGIEYVARIEYWEPLGGGELWFDTQGFEDRELAEDIGGVARRGTHGRGAARFTRPEPRIQPLPTGTLFPIEHINAILDAAAAGRDQLLLPVFDGSTEDGLYDVSAFIGAVRPPAPTSAGVLAGLRSWPVRLAYYLPDASEPIADFEMSLRLYENGVAGDMVYDYGDFTITVEPRALEILADTGCR